MKPRQWNKQGLSLVVLWQCSDGCISGHVKSRVIHAKNICSETRRCDCSLTIDRSESSLQPVLDKVTHDKTTWAIKE